MSFVPSKIRKMRRSRSTRSTPGSYHGGGQILGPRREAAACSSRPAAPPQQRSFLYLHEAHAPHDLDALICHLPGCLLGTKKHLRLAWEPGS